MHKELPSMQHFAVNILASDQEEIARRFAESVDDHRFEGVGFTRGLHGIPLLDDTLANLECRQVSLYQGGDHTIVVGEVEAANMRDAKPLLYYRGGFAQIDR
jgi:flavin reductase (DIM6/NTAB) family NADH-FMN oxidoreductase RutF